MSEMSRVFVALAVTASLCAAAVPADAGDGASEGFYLRYCGACHGPDGKGDGVVSGLLEKKPSDLTLIARRNGGEFPFNQTMQFIDGQKSVRAHGDAEMPIWGEVFKEQTAASPTRQAEIRGKILMITEYVRSIQRE